MVTYEERMRKLSPERRARIEARIDEIHQEYLALKKLREMLNLTQEEMATRIGVKQPAISKLESGELFLTLDTLSTVIASLGGEWELTVRLPDIGSVRLTGSEDFQDARVAKTGLTDVPSAQGRKSS